MNYKKLGNTNLEVSTICLGTMTWGEQNTQEDGFEQMDYALDQGVNFWDTAEIYSIPPKKETFGHTEVIIGNWFEKTKKREKVILASKVCGPMREYVRGGGNQFGTKNITEALEGSLKRLKTDYIDLYQLHWPERKTNFFGKLGYEHDDSNEWTQFEDILSDLKTFIDQGKIRYIGLSNETAWGTMQFIKIANENNFDHVVSIQNEYSLLCRFYDTDLAEVSHNENISLLSYSPLAAGLLSGKYQDGKVPEKSRLKATPGLMGRFNPRSLLAVANYLNIAKKYQLNPVHMALAFCDTKPFMGSTIFGATTNEQLKTIIKGLDVELSDEVLSDLDKVHREFPFPI